MQVTEKISHRYHLINRLRKAVGFFFFLVFCCYVYLNETGIKAFLGGLFLVAAGEILRIWAIGYVKKAKELTRIGPYRYLRHPLYTGSFLVGLGFCIISQNMLLIALFLMLFGLLYVWLIHLEEILLFLLFGAEYDSFCREVPRFLPTLKVRGIEQQAWPFNWKNLIYQREYIPIAGIIFLTLWISMNLK